MICLMGGSQTKNYSRILHFWCVQLISGFVSKKNQCRRADGVFDPGFVCSRGVFFARAYTCTGCGDGFALAGCYRRVPRSGVWLENCRGCAFPYSASVLLGVQRRRRRRRRGIVRCTFTSSGRCSTTTVRSCPSIVPVSRHTCRGIAWHRQMGFTSQCGT